MTVGRVSARFCLVVFGAVGCSGADIDGPIVNGGSGGASAGAGQGGAVTTGGSVSQGGTPNNSGGMANGGNVTSGGASAGSGGKATSGGASVGGGKSSGGANASGGSAGKSQGGASSGGANTGGASAGGSGGAGGLSSGCGKTGAKTGQFQAAMKSADLDRGYYASVPTNYDANTPYALVFGYHGSNYTGKMMRSYLDNEKAPLQGKAIFIYPDGIALPDQPDHIAWVLTEGSRDLVFFDDMYRTIGEQYCIDYSKVLVNGQSFGGLMTNALGCLRGDVIRAIAVVAGSGPRSPNQCKGQVAAWLTHGTDDGNVSFASGEKSRDHWVQANHCTTTTMPGTPASCQVYQGCDAGHPVIWCPHTGDGGHQHPSYGREAVRQFFGTFL